MDLKHVVAAIRHCGRAQALRHGKSFQSRVIKTGYFHNVYVASNLMSMYVDCSFLEDAHQVFAEMPQKNIVTWTTLVSAYIRSRKPREGIKLYLQMLDSNAEVPNSFMYSVILKACGIVGDIGLGKAIHKRISRENLYNDIVLMNTLLDMYVKCGNLDAAREVFDGIFLDANSTTWNTIISGYCKEGQMEEAAHLFNQMPNPSAVSWNSIIAGFVDNRSTSALEFVCKMHRQGFKLDDFTFPCALKSCSYVGSLAMGEQIHSFVIKSGFASSCFSMSALVDMYSNCNKLNEAIKLFDHYSSCKFSVSDSLAIWNSMLSGYAINGQNRQALSMLSKIHLSDACLDSYTFRNALKVCINLPSLRLGIQVHGLIVICGYDLDYIIGSILVDFYAKLGNIRDSFALFHRLPKKDTVAWSGLIMGCTKMGLDLLAFSLFRDMINLDLEVDHYVISHVLKICSSLISLRSGKQVHAFCIKNGYETEGVSGTALIDMYSKCGEIEDGITLFNSILDRDVVCWTGIIVGCGQNGRSKEAVEFYQNMVEIGLKPNEITFLGVLAACRHAGLIDEAWNIFKSMKFDHGLEPHMEHYYCMIDLLGQAGNFEAAEKLISEMPFKPDKTIWSSLLGACATHRNSELISTIEKSLLATCPDDPSVYVMLSNAYATLEMWDCLSKVREAAKTLGTKEAGKSWIETSS